MPTSDLYIRGTVLAWLLRFGLYGGIAAIAVILSNCSMPKSTDILTSMSAGTGNFSQREGNQTRNDEPQSGGCHEKSDSSLRKPST